MWDFFSCSLSSSTMGSWWLSGWVLWPAFLDGVGRRSWMKVGGLVGAGIGILVRMVSILGNGIVDYWETYAPVVNWASVRILLAVAKIHGLSSKSIDFVLAFPQADLEVPVYMELPMGFDAPDNES
jgi:hypothetical protein